MAIERQGAEQRSILTHHLPLGDGTEPLEGVIEIAEAERARFAAFLKIETLDSYSFYYRLKPVSQGRFRLTGGIDARLTQLCVVTLEPVSEHVAEDVELECWPADQIDAQSEEDGEPAADMLPGDPPVPIIEGKIDLGALAAEILANAINLYPRKEGAEFEWKDAGGEADKQQNPFAALANLKLEK